ncbi:hypothetical protein J2Z66_004580 [Paenibacillus eucommiae]|uniref:Holin-like toxin n=1 Tax=Paenibacillus eucommiae TaxID=1355755 RepID=A0ABS4IZE5_9BACL|nr:hypothetical protein [Paenibacillus eucommiae]
MDVTQTIVIGLVIVGCIFFSWFVVNKYKK